MNTNHLSPDMQTGECRTRVETPPMFHLMPDAARIVERIRVLTGAPNMVTVLRRAISVYSALATEIEAGADVVVVRKNGTRATLQLGPDWAPVETP